jgi:hypothetical protein
MCEAASDALNHSPDDSDQDDEATYRAALPGSGREVRWKVVTETGGLMPAEVIAGRLRAEGIPARAYQEGAGRAFALTVGLLGTGYVTVPEEYLEQAKRILEQLDEEVLMEEWDDDENAAED